MARSAGGEWATTLACFALHPPSLREVPIHEAMGGHGFARPFASRPPSAFRAQNGRLHARNLSAEREVREIFRNFEGINID